MEENMFEQAQNSVKNLLNMRDQGNITDNDKQLTQKAIQAAYEHATPEEEQQLKQLEQQLTNQTK